MEAFLPYLPFTLTIIAATLVAIMKKIDAPIYFIVVAFLLAAIYPNKAKAEEPEAIGVFEFTYYECPDKDKGRFVVFWLSLYDKNEQDMQDELVRKVSGCYDYVGDDIIINWALNYNDKLIWIQQKIPKKDMKKINSREVAI